MHTAPKGDPPKCKLMGAPDIGKDSDPFHPLSKQTYSFPFESSSPSQSATPSMQTFYEHVPSKAPTSSGYKGPRSYQHVSPARPTQAVATRAVTNTCHLQGPRKQWPEGTTVARKAWVRAKHSVGLKRLELAPYSQTCTSVMPDI
jgi:hypothetical protein